MGRYSTICGQKLGVYLKQPHVFGMGPMNSISGCALKAYAKDSSDWSR